MGLRWQDWPPQVLGALRQGAVIPAHPLALDAGCCRDGWRKLQRVNWLAAAAWPTMAPSWRNVKE